MALTSFGNNFILFTLEFWLLELRQNHRTKVEYKYFAQDFFFFYIRVEGQQSFISIND